MKLTPSSTAANGNVDIEAAAQTKLTAALLVHLG
jgi:hypothetical protein